MPASDKERDFHTIGYPSSRKDEEGENGDNEHDMLMSMIKSLKPKQRLTTLVKGEDFHSFYDQFSCYSPDWDAGASGSPILDKNQEVVGVLTMASLYSAFGVKFDCLKDLLDSQSLNIDANNSVEWIKQQEQFLEDAASEGNLDAKFRLADQQFSGKDEEADGSAYEEAASQGEVLSAARLGHFYSLGIGGPKNIKKAKKFLTISSQKGMASSQKMLSSILSDEKSFKESFYWIERAAKQGDVVAECYLANLFYKGDDGVEKDLEKAKCWNSKAVKRNSLEAIELQREMEASESE